MHGGSVVAIWGIPSPEAERTQDDADHALSTALEVRKFAKTLNDALKKNRLPEVTLAIGIHCGTVVAGQIGTDERKEYTAFGEALEIAARIQGFTEQFGTDILITGKTMALVPAWYSTEKVAEGDDNTPELYELVGMAKQAVQASKAKAKQEAEAAAAAAEPKGDDGDSGDEAA
jgi:adenylate cyclase